MTDEVKRFIVEGLPRTANYSHAVSYGDLIFLSGITGHSTEDTSFSEQFNVLAGRLRKTLEAAGSSFENVLKVTVYLSDRKYFREFNELFNGVFTSPPVRTTIVCSFVHDHLKLEMELIAARTR